MKSPVLKFKKPMLLTRADVWGGLGRLVFVTSLVMGLQSSRRHESLDGLVAFFAT